MAIPIALAPTPSPAESGPLSFYSAGHFTASGAPFRPSGLSMAHASCVFGSRWRIEANHRSVVVECNDRPGPGVRRHGRIADISEGAARALGIRGIARGTLTLLSTQQKDFPNEPHRSRRARRDHRRHCDCGH